MFIRFYINHFQSFLILKESRGLKKHWLTSDANMPRGVENTTTLKAH